MKRVALRVHHRIPRAAFRSGTFSAMLEDEDAREYVVLATTKQYDTWEQAARAGLKLADGRGYFVVNRMLVERKIAKS